VVAERKENGPYKSLFDFCKRNDSRKVTKRVLEALIKAGAMDELGPHRATMMASIASVQQAAEQFAQNKARNQNDLFAMGGDEDDGASLEPPFKEIPRWPDKTTLQFEYDTLGFYLSGHPFDAYAQEARNFTCCNLRNLPSKMDSAVTIAGLVVGIRKIKTQRGKLIVIVTLDDGTSKADVTVFSEVFEKSEHALEKGNLVVIEGDASHDSFNDGVKVLAKRVWAAEEARHQFARRIRLELKSDEFQKTTVGQLAQLLGSFQGGGCPVHLIYKNEVGKALIPLGKKWEVAPRETLLQSLKKLFPEGDIKIDY
jgi:DNA polymerase-3 subunit alpha